VNRYGIFDAVLVGGGDDENENQYKNDSDSGWSVFHFLTPSLWNSAYYTKIFVK
jgi:hypothetical protein